MKLKGKDPNNRGKDRKGTDDKSLAPGGSYFVAEEAYARELQNPVHATRASVRLFYFFEIIFFSPANIFSENQQEKEKCTCDAKHRAFDQSDTKFNKGFSVTGVGGIVCLRHGVLRPKAVGDLQKGER